MVFLRLLKQFPLSARIGLAIVFLNIVAAILAPVVAPYPEDEIVGSTWEPWSNKFFLGTDHLGRDLFTRLLYGARNTISVAFITTLLTFFLGTAAGFFAAVFGGWVDQLLSRIVDIFMAFPTLIFSLMALSVLGTSIPIIVFVLAFIVATRIYRLARAIAMDIMVMDYIEIARVRGEKIWWIMGREILPNAMPPLAAEFGLRFCLIFLFISALSFLGLGIQPPTADWGGMVRENGGAISFGIITPLLPAGAIAFLTIGVNLIVDWFLRRTSELREIA